MIGGLDIVIISNNRGGKEVGIIGGWTGLKKRGFLVLTCLTKHNAFFFFSINGHIFPIQFNTRKLRNDGI